MKTMMFGPLCVLAFAVPANVSVAADRDAATPVPLETLDLVLRDFSLIYAGMTRAELREGFRQDGGLYTATSTRFVHPLCLYCKVLITFEVTSRTSNGASLISDSDKVKAVSKPYLEPMFLD